MCLCVFQLPAISTLRKQDQHNIVWLHNGLCPCSSRFWTCLVSSPLHCDTTRLSYKKLRLKNSRISLVLWSVFPMGTEALNPRTCLYICIKRPFHYLVLNVPTSDGVTSSLACGSGKVPVLGLLFAVWGTDHPVTHSRTAADTYSMMWTPWRAKATCWGPLGLCVFAPVAPACWIDTCAAPVVC